MVVLVLIAIADIILRNVAIATVGGAIIGVITMSSSERGLPFSANSAADGLAEGWGATFGQLAELVE